VAFRSAALDRPARTIDVDMMAAAAVSVTVVVSRNGTRLGRRSGEMDRGGTVVSVRIGPRGLRPLRKGIHVDVAIWWGGPEPLRAHPALVLAPREDGRLAA
jgi:hypothetical protein